MENEQYDKVNGDIAFTESTHTYVNTKHLDRKYISVTTLIGEYHQKFDSEFWASYKACEALMGSQFEKLGLKFELLEKKKFDSVYLDTFEIDYNEFEEKKQEILASYGMANKVACERGNIIHNAKENQFYEKAVHRLQDYNFDLHTLNGDFACQRHDFTLNRDKAILPEYLMYYSTKDGILNIAGQADIVIKDGNDIYILDHKSNAKGIKNKAYFDVKKKKKQMMFYPINNMDDHMLNHYTLQLSLYAWILQKISPDFQIKLLRLLHIDGNQKETIYDLDYKREEVERMLKHYKKTLKVQHYRETGELQRGEED